MFHAKTRSRKVILKLNANLVFFASLREISLKFVNGYSESVTEGFAIRNEFKDAITAHEILTEMRKRLHSTVLCERTFAMFFQTVLILLCLHDNETHGALGRTVGPKA